LPCTKWSAARTLQKTSADITLTQDQEGGHLIIEKIYSTFQMTLSELEIRVTTLEQKLADLQGKTPTSPNINSWIDQIHGTFKNDSTYRQAARLGRQWRRAQHP
jgi:hypothetical protein